MEREALLSGLVHPGGREPAPEPLRLVQAFVNTVDREHGPDLLADAAGLEEWLRRHDLAVPVRSGEEDSARSAREALRSLLWANNGEPYDAAAADVLSGAARHAGLEPTFSPGEAALVPRAGGVDGVVGRILAVAFAAMLDGGWRRLKACPGHRCGWAFYDRSTNASATWCSMQVCGGRAKAGAYYRRRRQA